MVNGSRATVGSLFLIIAFLAAGLGSAGSAQRSPSEAQSAPAAQATAASLSAATDASPSPASAASGAATPSSGISQASPAPAPATPAAEPTVHYLSAGAAGIFPDPTATPTPTPIVHVDPPGMQAYKRTRDLSYLDPASWSVTAYKSRHQLIVYYKGKLFKTYRAVFGRSFEHGTKQWEGDRRTPEGLYTIIEKHPSRRWRMFLTLNYPNAIDRDRYLELKRARELPVEDGQVIGLGGRIGIHGTDNPILNRGNINWTTGCISVENNDILELDSLLPVGTVVVIKP